MAKVFFFSITCNIVISFLNPIEPGLEKEKFVEKLQDNIYKEVDLID